MKRFKLFVMSMSLVTMSSCSYDIIVDTDLDGTPDDKDVCPEDPGLANDEGNCGCNMRSVNGKCVYMGLADWDGDGVPDDNDGCPEDKDKITPGVCGCGKRDVDSDGDGVLDCNDECADNSQKTEKGYCGCKEVETDSDGDGIPDCVDQCKDDKYKIFPGICGCNKPDIDSDGDGMPDCNDDCPDDKLKTMPLACGCGQTEKDSDGDGFPDCIDVCPNDATKAANTGVCGCNVNDVDNDGDTVLDCIDACPDDVTKSIDRGICGCNFPDEDLNGNGVIDCSEKCLTSTIGKETVGYCGCFVEETDTDGDTIPDCADMCPDNPDKVVSGICGCLLPDIDTDNDGVLDCEDTCPFDKTKSTDTGICGCQPTLEYDETFDDTFDTDGDGRPDCTDDCPFDATRTDLHACACGSAGIDEKDGTKWVCVEKGGVIQADYSDTLNFYLLPENTHRALARDHASRRVTTPHVRLAFMPGGNLLENPALEYDEDGWTVSSSFEKHYASGGCEPRTISRPFGQYPLCLTYLSGTTFKQQLTLPNITSNQPLYAAMFAFTQSMNGGAQYSTDPISIKIDIPSMSSANLSTQADKDKMKLFSTKQTVSSAVSGKTATFSFFGKDSGGWAGHYGAQLHYFSAYLGNREVRFSNDGKNWTPWQTFDFSKENTWYIENWDLTNIEYGGNDTYGAKTVYMQTHDIYTDKYYQTSNTFEYYKPKEGGELFIGDSNLKSQSLTTKDQVCSYIDTITLSTSKTNIYFMPAANLLKNATLADAENNDHEADHWDLNNATILWRSETTNESTRHLTHLPVVSLNDKGSAISQTITFDAPVTNKFFSTVSAASTLSDATSLSFTSYLDDVLLHMPVTIPLQASTSNTKATSNAVWHELSHPFNTIKYTITSTKEAVTRLDTIFANLGVTYVRFSFDNRQSWTRWFEVSQGTDYNSLPESLNPLHNSVRQLVYPDANIIASDHKATVCMQTYNSFVNDYYEVCREIKTTF